ncbi:calcium-binding protein [uncultured Roseobacter sp.]|uniref:calcium-binding protein n=1 Tax=uncultured Roseobacter sp. TaxID=114847 RepID=UPI00261C8485|nr:calcium-binding protein [uncultured Roseobacter sp.]
MTDYTLRGTSGHDFLRAWLPGSHYIHAGSGNDEVVGSNYGDLIYGYYGNDVIYTGRGDDTVYGGGGDDNLVLSAGDDYLHGGTGSDYVSLAYAEDSVTVDLNAGFVRSTTDNRANIGNNTINYIENVIGSNHRDVVYGNSSSNTAYGGGGNDYFRLRGGHDKAYGGEGYDTFIEGAGNDFYSGGAGFDKLMLDYYDPADGKGAWLDVTKGTLQSRGGELDIGFNRFQGIERFDLTHGDDIVDSSDHVRQQINLERGDDMIVAGFNDVINGGRGKDTLDLSKNGVKIDRYELKEGKGYIGDDALLKFKNIEVFLGSESAETFRIPYMNDLTVYAKGGHDMLIASGQNLLLSGDDGNDTFSLHNASGKFYGGNGKDVFHVSNTSGEIYGGKGSDNVHISKSGVMDELLYVENANVFLDSDSHGYVVWYADDADGLYHGADTVYVNTGSLVQGSDHDDIFIGNAQSESRMVIRAGDGEDSIYGSEHVDNIAGEGGNDLLEGGQGADYFVFNAKNGDFDHDTITDFMVSNNKSAADNLWFIGVHRVGSGGLYDSFDDFDSNGDGFVSAADDEIERVGEDLVMNFAEGAVTIQDTYLLVEENFHF